MSALVPIILFEPIGSNHRAEAEAFVARHITRDSQDDPTVREVSERIVEDVRKNGDTALFAYTKEFDKAAITANSIQVTEAEIQEALASISPELKATIKRGAERIRTYHQRQRQNSWFDTSKEGEILGQLVIPVDAAGVYVPGGTAPLASSALMCIIPAQVAGVERIIVATPPSADGKIDPSILVAVSEAGATEIYKMGGAQAIAALAFGTETVPRADKIVGPGNIYVAMAKRAVFGYAGIDSIAGPSDITVVADETANPVYVAADLLSQAEHDERATAILVTTSQALAEDVQEELSRQAALLERKDTAYASLKNNGVIFLADTIRDAFDLANAIGPEHLEICTADPFEKLTLVRHAGAVFLGNYTPEPLGDYMAGPNHVLPTDGTARFFSALSVDDFIKKTSVLSFSQEAMERLGEDVARFARSEGLGAHANAVEIRTL